VLLQVTRRPFRHAFIPQQLGFQEILEVAGVALGVLIENCLDARAVLGIGAVDIGGDLSAKGLSGEYVRRMVSLFH